MTQSPLTADAPRASGRADVEVRVPADGAYVSVLRTTTAGLAARLDFTLDDVEDLRIAVGEACAVVLPEATDAGDLTAAFWLSAQRIHIEVSVPTDHEVSPDEDSFAWQVLTTLADEAGLTFDGTRCVLALTHHPTPLETGR
ncbi:anti-sigma factor [Nocardioides sp. TRM66260-LWL]|uniref:anti-sigma factor n=1 Tax=Nocardioides sp. TRM66260-LWL TaxID=2874478 RepID=UPI001CC5F72B|nr:anti-sigma factor [Nocardioides sp. TRM66260-LWL]MBZ5734283.1 anti-sigma factor [Nocardioides sp. TRM66260-LWL]